MGKQVPLFEQPMPGLEHFVSEPASRPNTAHAWVRVELVIAHRVEWVCNDCGTRAAPDAVGRMYFLRSTSDCEGKS